VTLNPGNAPDGKKPGPCKTLGVPMLDIMSVPFTNFAIEPKMKQCGAARFGGYWLKNAAARQQSGLMDGTIQVSSAAKSSTGVCISPSMAFLPTSLRIEA
jgi:hypothetical protein